MKVIIKIFAFLIGAIVAIAIITLFNTLIVLLGGTRPSPAYGAFSLSVGTALGIGAYKRVCNLFLKKDETEQLLESQSLDNQEANDDEYIINTKPIK